MQGNHPSFWQYNRGCRCAGCVRLVREARREFLSIERGRAPWPPIEKLIAWANRVKEARHA